MSKFSVMMRLARTLGPTLAIAVARYGPQIRQIIKENPEAFDRITKQFSKVARARSEQNSPGGFARRCEVLREQVTYLYASANSAEVARQASAWRKEIEAIERAVPLLDAMGRRQRLVEKRKLEQRIDELSAKILEASLVDDIEDAEFTDSPEDFPNA